MKSLKLLEAQKVRHAIWWILFYALGISPTKSIELFPVGPIENWPQYRGYDAVKKIPK